jgi:hypothetical protein
MHSTLGPDWDIDARGWTGIGGRLGATDRIRDGGRDWPSLWC